VACILTVADAGDPRLADYVRLRDVGLRRSMEAAHGLFIAEGEKVIRRAVGAGYPVRSLLLTREQSTGLADLLGRCDAPVYVVADDVAEALTGFVVHRGALASCGRLELPAMAEVIRGQDRILVLEDIVDHGNVGGIFRCAAALGVGAVVLSPRCADPLYRRSVKVSMGAVFAIPYARMSDWHGGLAELRAAGFQLLALTPDQCAAPIEEVTMASRVALLLGCEGDGLSARWLSQADQPVCIRMNPAAMAYGVDSLNVAAAAAVACYGLMRAR
jgi:tRNA G18 (ribose-2'-O)-methylase SpoU